MVIPEWSRLLLYIAVAVLPVWTEFFTKSTDYSLRGLMMPILSTLLTAATVTLARTKSTSEPNQPPPAQ